jgi:eukaryotic-like serine/threonine-protein kinase
MALETGARLGPHEILGLLGAGGMGEVYRALDTKLNRQVAIKVLPEPYASDPERVARFHREAQAVAALNHPGIAAIYELAESGDTKFLVLEIIEGETLADRLRRGAVPVDDAIAIGRQIVEALEAAHEKGICHRDLKPANVKLTPDGSVKVLDFGLAKFMQAGAVARNLTHSPTLTVAGTLPGVILGTAAYMSPEQAKGFEADQRSDLFAFGCIMYELLTGREAFQGETASEILASVIKVEPDLTALPPRLNPRLLDLLRRCLEKNPKKRWHSAADVRVEIELLIGRELVVDEPRAAAAVVPPWKHAIPVAAALVVGGFVAGFGTWILKPAPARTVTRFTIVPPADQRFASGPRPLVALSPDGANLAYSANRRLYLRPMSAFDARAIPGSDLGVAVATPAFSPNGQSIAFWTALDRTLKRIPITGGAPLTLCPTDALFGLSWDESGILFGQVGKGIMRVSENGGTAETVVTIGADEIAAGPQTLPDGKSILYSVKKNADTWDKGQVVVQSVGSGQRKMLVSGGADGRYLPTGHLVYASSGVLLAVPFDVGRLAVTGSAVVIVEGVQRFVNANGPGLAQFAYAANGTLAYLPGPVTVAASGGFDLAVFDRSGGSQPLKLPLGVYRAPRVSSDGKFVAFESVDDSGEEAVWIYEIAGGTSMRRLTFGGRNRAPVWSPDGQWIAFQSDREGDLAIFRQRADGNGTAERLTKPDLGARHTPQSWSSDGAQLLVTEEKDRGFTLRTLTLKDRQLAAFGDVRSIEPTDAAFSPDGQWVVYQARGASGPRQVFVQPFPATGAKYLVPHGAATVLTGPGHPFWNRKGTEIILNAAPTSSYAVSFTARPQVQFGRPADFPREGRTEPNPSTTRRWADAMPDGDHIMSVTTVAATQGTQTPQEIAIVLNWFDEIRQRVPGK